MGKGYIADILLLVFGLLIMTLLLLLGALSEGWVALLCFLATAVVYHTWLRHLVRTVARTADIEVKFDSYDDLDRHGNDDQDIFPSA